MLSLGASATLCLGQPAGAIQFSASTYEVSETNLTAILAVQRAGDPSASATVDYASSGGSATAGADYTDVSGTIVFAPGESVRPIAVPILNDAAIEPPEAFTVTLANPTGGAVLGTRATATVRMLSNDTAIGFEFGNYRVAEEAGSVVLGVRRGDDGDFPVTVDFGVTNLTATDGVDYVAISGTLTFAPGEHLELLTVPILNDGAKEAAETFRVFLSNATGGAALGARQTATISIADNDSGVQFAHEGYWGPEYLVEESHGQKTVTVLRGSDDVSQPFTVDFVTTNGTATADLDYVATQGTLSFAPGEKEKTFTLPVLADDQIEPDEHFSVELRNPTGGAVLGGTRTVMVRVIDSTGATAHRIEGISRAPGGGVELKVGGNPGSAVRDLYDLYPIEVSDDLRVWWPWVTLMRTNASAQPLSWTDHDASGADRKFYRTHGTTFTLATPFGLKPTGPFPVGVRWQLLTDPSRRNRYGVSTNSSFMVTVWYPAVPQPGQFPAPVWHPRSWPYLVSHATMDAPCAEDRAPYPVVLYSHGFGLNRGSASEKGPYLASHGYVVVATDHYDTDGSVFPDGSYHQASSPALDEAGLRERVADQLFVLAELARWSREDPDFAGRLNLDAVAAVGSSFGGVTAAELARIEPRCRAAVLFDPLPWFPAQLSATGVQKPLLQINASDNAEAVLYTRATADAIWFQISRSEHGSMGGHDYYWAWYPDLVNVREAARTVNAFTLAFLNRHLKGLDAPLLDRPPADFPRIANWKKL
ncbi:MAG: Calx-beta domain-containing protein [Limisphaerales bacterium]